MKKILVAAAALVWFAPSAAAQANASSNVTATVIKSLSITKDRDLAFGNVIQGATKEVQKGSSNDVGKFSIAGQPNANISISYDQITALASGVNSLPYTQGIAVNASDDSVGATDLAAGAGTVTLDGSGNAYVYLYGSVTAGASQATGDYTAPVQVTVNYN